MAFEQIYNIPMIIKLPGQKRAGETIDSYVSLLDLAPTFCEISGGSMKKTDGCSLLGLLNGTSNEGERIILLNSMDTVSRSDRG